MLLSLLFVSTVSQTNNQPSKSDCDPDSGWQCDYEPAFSHRNGHHTFCDLDIIQLTDSMDEFLEKCYFKKPCLINTTIEDWTNPKFWYKNNLLSLLGQHKFDAGKSVDLVLKAGIGELKYFLNQYLQLIADNKNNYTLKEPMYIFDHTIWDTEHGKFRANHIKRDNISFYDFAASKIHYNAAILALGNTGTGAAFHAHGENWLFLVAGRKRWFLYPPNLQPVGGFWPGYSSKDWFEFIYPNLHQHYDYNNYEILSNYNLTYEIQDRLNKPRSNIFHRNINGEFRKFENSKDILLTDYKHMNDAKIYGNAFFKPLECMQSKGQIIYLPEFWWHSVLNLGNLVIGAAVQTSHARTPWMLERDVHDKMRRGVVEENGKTDLEREVDRLEGVYARSRLTKYGPISAVHHAFMGFEFYDMSEYEYAIKHLTHALLMDPTYIEAYTYLSRIYGDARNTHHYDLEMAEDILRIGYMLNMNNDNIRRELLGILRLSRKMNLIRFVERYEPLPPKQDTENL